jgi:hypothetical protein
VILTQKNEFDGVQREIARSTFGKSQQIDWIKGTQKKMVGGTLRQPREN